MRLGKTVSVLPNSSPSILLPMPNGLEVTWDEERDQHVLTRHGEPIAAHHNGFSCHCLAVRMNAGAIGLALDQFDYIETCGGSLFVDRETFAAMLKKGN